MGGSLQKQIRDYFEAVDEEQAVVDLTAIHEGRGAEDSIRPAMLPHGETPDSWPGFEHGAGASSESFWARLRRPVAAATVGLGIAVPVAIGLFLILSSSNTEPPVSASPSPVEAVEPSVSAAPPPGGDVEPPVGVSPAPTVEAEPAVAELDPEAVLRSYYAALDAKDLDGMLAVLADDLIILNHPFNINVPIEGEEAIVRNLRTELGNSYVMVNAEVSGNVVAWDVDKTEADGTECIVLGNVATVEGGLITEWLWGEWACGAAIERQRDRLAASAETPSSAEPAATAESEPVPAGAGPEAVLVSYYAAVNAKDLDGMLALLADDLLIFNHPFNLLVPVEGEDAIVRNLRTELGDSYAMVNVDVSGNAVAWDLDKTHPDGTECVVLGNEATVEAGKITEWAWGEIACGAAMDRLRDRLAAE